MKFPASRAGRTAAAGAVVLAAVAVAPSAAGARLAGHRAAVPAARDPYSPAYHHQYRRGVVPTIGRLREMAAWSGAHPSSATGCCLRYHGGLGGSGAGVFTGAQKVYLVFYGSQWGATGTDGNGYLTLSGDPSGEAPYVQALFKGLGMGSETWSGVMTQYCQGVAAGSTSCPASSTQHVDYPAGGALAGVWADEAAPSPSQATGHQLGAEAVRAAKHFGNTTATANRDAQYLILSPTGTQPDGFPHGFCAWHDYTGDAGLGGGAVTSSYGPLAFTNLPYLTDAGAPCGEDFLNSGSKGLLDGVSIVAGHEYAESITDPYPVTGWAASGSQSENGDLCGWNSGSGDHIASLTLPTGSFAMQPTWANDGSAGTGSCEFSHPVSTNGGIFNSGFETGTFFGWNTSGTTAIVTTGQYAGTYAAKAGASVPTGGSSRIWQTFRAVGTRLSLWYDVVCPDTAQQSWTAVTLTDNSAGKNYTIVPRTCLRSSGWKEAVATVIIGHSYTLRLTSHDDDDTAGGDGAYATFDRVRNY